MLIDCDTCAVRDVACHECVVGALLGTPAVPPRTSGDPAGPSDARPGGPLPLEFGPVERRALEVLADHGLIPPLRLVAPTTPPAPPPTVPPTVPPQGARGAAGPRRARDAG